MAEDSTCESDDIEASTSADESLVFDGNRRLLDRVADGISFHVCAVLFGEESIEFDAISVEDDRTLGREHRLRIIDVWECDPENNECNDADGDDDANDTEEHTLESVLHV